MQTEMEKEMETGKFSNPTYLDYLSSGLVPLLCNGYHPRYNPGRVYKTAKIPTFDGWNSPEYIPPTLEEIREWEKTGGWTGWRMPKGLIALDVEESHDIDRVGEICRARGIEPGIHVTNNGKHFLFSTDLDLPASSKVFTKCGVKVTYRAGLKSQLILCPTNGRTWALWKKPEELPHISDELLPYDRKSLHDVMNCLSWQVAHAYREGRLSGYDDIDAAFMALLIECGL